MRTVTIIIEATHNENSDTALAGALARFAAKNLNTLGYRVQDIVCSDKEYRLPEEPPKPEVEDATPSAGEEAAPKSKPLIDPADFSIPQLRGGVLDGYIRRQLTSLFKREMNGKARDGAIAAIKDAIDIL